MGFLKRHKQLLPVLLLLYFCLTLIADHYRGTIGFMDKEIPFVLRPQHYLSIAAALISVIVYLQWRRQFKYVLIPILALSFGGILDLNSIEHQSYIGINTVSMRFQEKGAMLIILSYVVNLERANRMVKKWLQGDKASLSKKIEQSNIAQVQTFKLRFAQYSDGMLEEIVQSKKYTPEALEAAMQLLKERHTIQSSDFEQIG